MTLIDIIQQEGFEIKPLNDKLWRMFCPFHNDGTTPNFTVYTKTDSYHCFSCQAHGDKIKFVMTLHNLSKEEAIKKVYGTNVKQYLNESSVDSLSKINHKSVLNRTISNMLYYNLNRGIPFTKYMDVLKRFDSDLKTFKDEDFSKMLSKYSKLLKE